MSGAVVMDVRKSFRSLLVAAVAIASIGLAGDPASGARAKRPERSDEPATRSGEWAGEPDGWVRTHERYVGRATRNDAEVLFLGDSITFSMGDEDREGIGNQAWRSDFLPLKAANFGFPGDQTQHLLWRVQHGELAGRPKVAVVLIGTNNLQAGQSPESTASGVVAVVDAIRKASPSTRVLLLGLLPREWSPNAPLRRATDEVNAILKAWAAGENVIYVDAGQGFLRSDGAMHVGLTTDFLHPSAEGYRVLGDAIRRPLHRMLGLTSP